ncbi:MAG: hypothetical protein KKE86_03525 [Planctomycetes bacterium]|nr:hypothetical protein [Planctomycetota bacterium]MBU4398387.1 hypothetical protein [Planctomycetota bacterium]MCG2683805.1 hypothetical protein [Planctomycetales bacterium]
MTEPNSSKHWDSLISDLGAIPPAEEESRRQPGPQQPQPARTEKPASAAHCPRPAADWDLIAGKLGVTPTPRPIEPPQEIVESSVAPAEAPRQVSITPERGEESPNFFDEQFDFEEPFDLLESAGGSAAAPKAEEPAEKRPRKRRRRRRPAKEFEDRKPSGPAPDDDSDRETAVEGVETAGVERTGDKPASSEQRRSKRSRPRRGKKRRPGDEQKPAESRAERGDGEPDEPRGESASHDDFDAEERSGEQSVRAGFRGIPTWGETVGLVIEKNLESRAKRPGGAQRGRGNKRRS